MSYNVFVRSFHQSRIPIFLMNIYNIFDWQTENKLVFDQMFFFSTAHTEKIGEKNW